MFISVVIPTCDQRAKLLSLLQQLDHSPVEIIIVDAGNDPIVPADYAGLKNILCIRSEKSVCLQRNMGIQKATAPWIFLCADDMEIPTDYLQTLVNYVTAHPEAGAVSGLVESLPGSLHTGGSGYDLSAALVKKEWLLHSPYDETLDRNGTGADYGVVMGFPADGAPADDAHAGAHAGALADAHAGALAGIQVLNTITTHHTGAPLRRPLRYFRTALALDYFGMKKTKLVATLTRDLVASVLKLDKSMVTPGIRSIQAVVMGRNPYRHAKKGEDPTIPPLFHRKRKVSAATGYDKWAATYDGQTDNPLVFLEDIVFSELLHNVDLKDKRVVDVGCGTGRHWAKMQTADIIGYEVSKGMADKLKQKYPDAQVHLLYKDILKEEADESCDLLVSTLVIGYIKDLSKAFTEWNRVVKENGEIIFTDFHPVSLEEGANRSFSHNGKPIFIKNYIHSLDKIRGLATQMGWESVGLKEKTVDETIKAFFERRNVLHVYEKAYGTPILYGWHFRKKRAGNSAAPIPLQ